jgi:sulfite oxidase
MNTTSPTLGRRHVLLGSVGALASAGLASFSTSAAAQTVAAVVEGKPLPGYAAWKVGPDMIVHSSNTLETKRSAFRSGVVTPSNQLYVRNNLPPPDAAILNDRDAWTVSVEGVKKPRSLTVGELKGMGLETVAMVLQCSGNGRAFFKHKASGTQWGVGAAGCVMWTGVPVRQLVEALGGVAADAVFMTGTGGEVLPAGIDPKSVLVERSVPLAAMADAMLAWEMNGEDLSLAHGGPLRLIVPGYTGVNNIKYVKRLAFTTTESDAAIMSHGYRIRPIGEKGAPGQASAQAMDVKSWINSPLPEDGALKAGKFLVQGVAFGGINAVKSVEVSADGGKTWAAARFVGPDLGRYAWRQFVVSLPLGAGQHTLASRATDDKGQVQPENRLENERGYNNSWLDHAVVVTVA